MGKQQAVVSKEELEEREKRRKGDSVVIELRQYLKHSESLNGVKNNLKIGFVFLPVSLQLTTIVLVSSFLVIF